MLSALAAELRSLAATYFREAHKAADPDAHRLLASAWHEQALRIEAGAGTDSLDDCTEVYADYPGDTAIFDLMDDDNGCPDPGGHIWIEISPGVAVCGRCRASGMPVYATREAE